MKLFRRTGKAAWFDWALIAGAALMLYLFSALAFRVLNDRKILDNSKPKPAFDLFYRPFGMFLVKNPNVWAQWENVVKIAGGKPYDAKIIFRDDASKLPPN